MTTALPLPTITPRPAPRRVVVTGGTGFLGRHLVWRLAAEGVDVVFCGRNAQAAQTVIELAPTQARTAGKPLGRLRFVALDHGHADALSTLSDASEGADALVHAAALSSPWGPAAAFERANVASTIEVIAAVRRHRIGRLVHVSTPSLYFDFRDRLGVGEDLRWPAPVNAYARTKGQAEQLLMQHVATDAQFASTVVLRPRAIFGPWDQTLLPRLLRVVEQGPVPLIRGGQAWLDLSYVDNVVHGLWLALTRELPQGHRLRAYNLSQGEPIQVAELFARIASAFELPLRTRRLPWPVVSAAARGLELYYQLHNQLYDQLNNPRSDRLKHGFKDRLDDAQDRQSGREPPLTRYGAGVISFSQTLDLRRIKAELGYTPQIGLTEAIAKTAHWYREQQGLVMPAHGPDQQHGEPQR